MNKRACVLEQTFGRVVLQPNFYVDPIRSSDGRPASTLKQLAEPLEAVEIVTR